MPGADPHSAEPVAWRSWGGAAGSIIPTRPCAASMIVETIDTDGNTQITRADEVNWNIELSEDGQWVTQWRPVSVSRLLSALLAANQCAEKAESEAEAFRGKLAEAAGKLFVAESRANSLAAKLAEAKAALNELVNRDCRYFGPVAHLPFDTHGHAIGAVSRARLALSNIDKEP